MIRFYRSIRHGLINEGKTSKYFRYAVGEILLVVIGILIALQVNNWNIERAEAKLAKTYIEPLLNETERNSTSMKASIKTMEMISRFLDLLMAAVDDPEVVRDRPGEFMVAVRQAGNVRRPPLISDTYDDLISTGHLRLLDDRLKSQINRFYRRDEQITRYQNSFQEAEYRFKELSAGVLSYDQSAWILGHYTMVFTQDLPNVEALEYDGSSVVEAAKRLRNKQELVEWLPQLKFNSIRNVETINASVDQADTLITMLKK